MRLYKEDEILDIGVRKQIIDEIESSENKARKADHFRRHMVYKDQIKYFVIKELEKQFDQKTIKEMEYALSSINLEKKVVDKLAKVYAHGVQRIITDEEGAKDEPSTEKVDQLSKELDVNQAQKTVNRYLKVHRNVAQYVKPCPYYNEDGKEEYTIKLQALAPYLYDVVEEYYNRTKPLVFILSPYDQQDVSYSSIDAAREGRTIQTELNKPIGDGRDQIIADTPEDEGKNKKQYIWWSRSYHFTTDAQGSIISQDTVNPIKKIPIRNYAIDQDNSFWARGGNDLSEGTILINALISHLHHIAVTQGYGQFYMKGKNLPRNIVTGPSKAILMEYEGDDPVPDVGFVNANPNLSGLMQMIEQYVALLLTTNNLSTSGVSTQLGQGQAFPSGIALMIDKAESMEDIQDQRQVFLDNEPELFEIISAWIKLYTSEGSIDEDLKGLELPEEFDLKLIFNQNQVLQTETEKLANIEKRKELGLNTMIDLMKMDQPDLTDQEAEEKLKEIMKEKLERMAEMMAQSSEQSQQDMKQSDMEMTDMKKQGAMNAGQEDQRQLETPVQ